MNRGVTDEMVEAAWEAFSVKGQMRAALAAALAAEPGAAEGVVPRLKDEWHEDHGDVVWWTWKGDEWLNEPSYIGSPLDTAWPDYHTHWTPHPAFPAAPHQSGESGK